MKKSLFVSQDTDLGRERFW